MARPPEEQRYRDLLAWALRLVEFAHAEGCPAGLDQRDGCECEVAEFGMAVLDLDIEPCAKCDHAEATTTLDNLPVCSRCAG